MPATIKVAIVTGGEKGIGAAITRELLQRHYRVVIAGIDRRAAEASFGSGEDTESLRFVPTDIASESDVRQMVETTVRTCGRIDAVVGNAAIASAHSGPPESLDLLTWNRIIGVNLTGNFLLAKHTFPHLRVSSGAIVFIASTRALQSESNSEAYAASKGGLLALTHALALSGSPHIRVNAISPGWIHHGNPGELSEQDHQQHPVGRVGNARDIAKLAAFLLSPDAAFITGQNHIADGGMSRKMIYLD